MSTVITNNMLSLIDARLKTCVLETNATIPLIGSKIVKEKKTTSKYEIMNRIVGVGEAEEVAEGAVYPKKAIKQDTSKTVNMKKFGFVIDVSRELIVDNLFGPIQDDVAKAMKNAMLQTKERRILNMLNNGFTATTGQLAQDGLSLFNTAHVLVQGGTQSNRASVNAALDLDSLWIGRNTMQTTKGNSGLYDAIYPAKYLVVPQELERRAHELVKSEWIPQSTENTANVIGSIAAKLEVLTSPLLSSTTAWFLIADPSAVLEFSLRFFNREEMSIHSLFNIQGNTELGNAIDKDTYSWRVRERYECDTPTWYGVYGNVGA